MDMKNFGEIDYLESKVPSGYKCYKCEATNCKLWRLYQTFLDCNDLLCAKCSSKEQNKNIDNIDANGQTEDYLGKSNQIGSRVPAIPTEECDTFWGITSVPLNGYNWWKNLPTLT